MAIGDLMYVSRKGAKAQKERKRLKSKIPSS
jgi:hypothetical protein